MNNRDPVRARPVDTLAQLVPEQLAAVADATTRHLLGSLGRTEDIALAPSGRRLALACFALDAVALVGFEADRYDHAVHFFDVVIVRAHGLARPHGVDFADENTVIVANRESEVVILDIGSATAVEGGLVPGRVVLDRRSDPPVRSPGSITATWISECLLEVIVCNNYAHDVTRHVLDRDRDWAVVDGEVLLERGLSVPDGVATESAGSWLAISNHLTNSVHMYRYREDLGPASEPDGVLRGSNFAHGLAFTADGRHLVVADAGLPYLSTYTTADRDWSGSRRPSKITRVMDDDSFNSGRHNPQEGGPKGVAITEHGDIIVTSQFQTLAVFRSSDVVGTDLTGDDTISSADPGADAGWSGISRRRTRGPEHGSGVRRRHRYRRKVSELFARGFRTLAGTAVRLMPTRWRDKTVNLAEELAEYIRSQYS